MGSYVHGRCKKLLFLAKTGKTSAYFLRFDIRLKKKSRSGFDLVTVPISKQSLLNIALGLFSKVNHIYIEYHCLNYTMLAHSFTKNQNKREYLPLFGFSMTMPLPQKVQGVTKEQRGTCIKRLFWPPYEVKK